MKVIVQYSCFQDQHLIEANLHHIYDFADRIVISYGAFRGVRQIRSLWGLPEEDRTLEILRSFPDPSGKLILVEAPGGEWEDFTESRKKALAECGTSGFLMTQDTDEFWAQGALERIGEVASHHLREGVVAIDCPRTWFVRGSDLCLWPQVGLPHVVPYARLDMRKKVRRALWKPLSSWGTRLLPTVLDRLGLSSIKKWMVGRAGKNTWTTFDYANGIAFLPSPPQHIYKVVGLLLKPGLFWIRNRIDSRLMDPTTDAPWHRHDRTIYDPSILCFHISYCDPTIALVKETYYKTVFEGLSPEQAYRELRERENSPAGKPAPVEVDGYRVQPLPEPFRDMRPQQLIEVTGSGE